MILVEGALMTRLPAIHALRLIHCVVVVRVADGEFLLIRVVGIGPLGQTTHAREACIVNVRFHTSVIR